ncbi:MAG: sigma 54-interacting transcriptional regulator [Deltaproteobacteria bacterium]|nr:sigma 54-interacting transcriptional regulator [Kofleriaceae bacterium]
MEIARFRVTVLDGPHDPGPVESATDEITVGSAPGQLLRLRDACVSRHHCVIKVGDEGLICEDLGSTNGTYVAGRRVTSVQLEPGDTITVGGTVLAVELLGDSYIEPLSKRDRFGRVLGRSVAMRRLFSMLERVASSDATILLEGETGTGKSALAEAIHECSRRAGRPFVVVDCGALPATLLESELFGHERGAFTGAVEQRIGLFESASGGTVLLDEIGELPLDLQPKLLRTLERRVIRRVGASREVPVDVRLIAATHRDLRRAVNQNAFRADLWYRLNTVRAVLPPLRERRDDIAMLVATFYAELAGDPGASPPVELVRLMMRGSWKGNVRELRSAVERALVGAPAVEQEADAASELDMTFRAAKQRATSNWEKQYLSELLPAHDGNVSRAARAARMDRGHLSELARRYGLTSPDDAPVDAQDDDTAA